MTAVQTPLGLQQSIPANNQKIIELYNKMRSEQIVVNKSYQRKLVWKNTHKFNFIDTILKNFPFPEIYLAPGVLDQINLLLIDEIVDGQQRLSTIRHYIEGTDVFALPRLPLKKFSELDPTERSSFLNYEVSIRYLKNVSTEQVREIFQRINKTDYSLNAAERLNAQWGESEFVCFAKQIVDPTFFVDGLEYVIDDSSKEVLYNFFHGNSDEDEAVFTENDKSRMLAYQYVMTIVATLNEQEYFNRNEKLKAYIEGYNDCFLPASTILKRLVNVVNFLNEINVPRSTRWYKKANLFTLIVELDSFDTGRIDSAKLREKLLDLDHRASLSEIGLESKMTLDEMKYIDQAREGVNQKHVRIARGKFIEGIIKECAMV